MFPHPQNHPIFFEEILCKNSSNIRKEPPLKLASLIPQNKIGTIYSYLKKTNEIYSLYLN